MAIPTGIPIALIPAIIQQQQQKRFTNPHPIHIGHPKQASEMHTNNHPQETPKNGTNGKSPFIGTNGNWYTFDDNANSYYDTGVSATGGGFSIQKTYIGFNKEEIYGKGEVISLRNSFDVFGKACSSVEPEFFVLDKGNYTLQLFIAGHTGHIDIGLYRDANNIYDFKGKNEIYSELSIIVPEDGMKFYLKNKEKNPILVDDSVNSIYNFVVTKWR